MSDDEQDKQIRMPTRPGGQKHFRDARDADIEATRTAIEAAIAQMEEIQGVDGYPSVDRLRAVSGNAFGRSTAYRVLDIIHAAQDAWRARERAAGREIPPKMAGKEPQGEDSVARRELERVQAELDDCRGKLTRALDGVDAERVKADRARKEADDFRRRNERLAAGVFETVWGEIEAEVAATAHERLEDGGLDREADGDEREEGEHDDLE